MIWHKIAESTAALFDKEREIKEVQAGEKEICVTQLKGKLYACAHKCPHAGAKMVEGYVDALGNIVCPLHRYKFSLERGRNVTGEGYFLKTYIVEERKEGVFVGIEQKNGDLKDII
jgi:3-phenylpropionate/trans-cinnamate dioxygenase ferredoxin subunit